MSETHFSDVEQHSCMVIFAGFSNLNYEALIATHIIITKLKIIQTKMMHKKEYIKKLYVLILST